jgi:ADP-ribosylglycohydrolase
VGAVERYTTVYELLRHELAQRAESGFDVVRVAEAAGDIDSLDPAEAAGLLAQLAVAPPVPDWPYVEPSDLADIEAEWPDGGPQDGVSLPADTDLRIAGGWRGRVSGNCLGKPVEQGHRDLDRLKDYLVATGNYPITDYVSNLTPNEQEMRLGSPTAVKGAITAVPRDDDIDYTILTLHLLETFGPGLTTADVAQSWLDLLPYHATYTAERATYHNLVAGVAPEMAAFPDNPYREWIGAQIRGDLYGFVHPGRPAAAARMAYRDARLSHVANGIYGEMWVAAFVAAAFSSPTLGQAFDVALTVVPARSRLAEALRWVRAEQIAGKGFERLAREVHTRYADLHWVHTVNNAAILSAALLTAGDDFTTAIGQTVAGGLDTDSSGANAGAIAGVFAGDAGVPAHWTDPFADLVRSALFGFDKLALSDLIGRTQTLARTFATEIT